MVVPRPLKMEEEEEEGLVETGRQAGVEVAAGEQSRALCWGEEVVVLPYLAGREEVEEEQRWALLTAEVEAALLCLWREVGEGAVLLWMVEVEVLVVVVHF